MQSPSWDEPPFRLGRIQAHPTYHCARLVGGIDQDASIAALADGSTAASLTAEGETIYGVVALHAPNGSARITVVGELNTTQTMAAPECTSNELHVAGVIGELPTQVAGVDCLPATERTMFAVRVRARRADESRRGILRRCGGRSGSR